MDPLSVTASIIAVVGAASSVGRSLEKLSILRGAPAGILALNNELSDLRLILYEIDTLLQNNGDSIRPSINTSLKASLYQAKEKLLELESVIEYQIMTTNSDGSEIKINRVAWTRNQGKIHKLQDSLHLIRLNLMVVLGLMIEDIRAHGQTGSQDNAARSTSQDQVTVDGVLSQIMESHREREQVLTRIQDRLTHVISNPNQSLDTVATNPAISYANSRARPDNTARFHALRLSTTCWKTCKNGCLCICHRRRRFQSPSVFSKVLGSMFFGYSGLPIVSSRCDRVDCVHGSTPTISFDYIFPTWFIARKVHVELRYRQNLGPEQLLRVSRIVHPYSGILRTAYEGDIEGMKMLLQNGGGSPFDVGSDLHFTPLIWATLEQHSELCKLLIHAGADPHEVDSEQRSSYDIAWRYILSNGERADVCAELQTIFNDADYSEESQFSFLHKVVLGLNPLNLLSILPDLSTTEINQGDARGRTPLIWAAIRGDSDAVRLLLEHGADPNKGSHGKSALYSAVSRRSYTCTDLLLRANADFNSRNSQYSVLCAAATVGSVEMFELLLSRGADIDAVDVSGNPVLAAALLNSNSQIAELLINKNVNINYINAFSTTALHQAIYENHPKIVDLLLRRGISHRIKSNTFGTILHCAGRRGNIEVSQVLTNAKLQNIDIEDKWEGLTALEHAEQRKGMSDEWLPTFQRLLDSINSTETATEVPGTPIEAPEIFFDAPETAAETPTASINGQGDGNNPGPGQETP